MAKIKQVGVGRKTTGTIDGITYYVRGGVTYARSTPHMPSSVYSTPGARLRQAIFKMVQMHLKYHLLTIKQTFTPKGNGSPTNRYYSMNNKGLTAALTPLAELYCNGQEVTLTDVEQAISDYAAEHPTSIKIAAKNGYGEVYLTGPWPETITLNANRGDNTVIVIVSESGTTTTITPNGGGGTTVSGGSDSNTNGTNNTNGSSSGGSSTGSGTNGGGSNMGGGATASTPKLTISHTGTGTYTVTANGNAVSSGAEIEANTEVSVSVTPAEGATPTATMNGSSVTLTESDGVYTGSFTMPSANATLAINSGGATGGGADMN